jgi:hypothetical protein
MTTQYTNNSISATAVEIQLPSNKPFVLVKSSNCLVEYLAVGEWRTLTNDDSPDAFSFQSPPSGKLKISRTDETNAKIEIYG